MSKIEGKCPQCGRGYEQKLNLTHHVLWLHGGSDVCRKCHHDPPESCELCGPLARDKEMLFGPPLSEKESKEEAWRIMKLAQSPDFWADEKEVYSITLEIPLLTIRAPESHEIMWDTVLCDFTMRKKWMAVAKSGDL